jgi:signal transduction histidine kinase
MALVFLDDAVHHRQPQAGALTFLFRRIEGIEQPALDFPGDPLAGVTDLDDGLPGLGLSVVYGIIQKHQGHVTVESSPGEGASFFIHLPLATDLAAPATA